MMGVILNITVKKSQGKGTGIWSTDVLDLAYYYASLPPITKENP
jgi:hypothetical protein